VAGSSAAPCRYTYPLAEAQDSVKDQLSFDVLRHGMVRMPQHQKILLLGADLLKGLKPIA
jgi:hypothetical protein